MSATTILDTIAPTQPDLASVKARQQVAWSSGDYAVVGTTLQIVGETLCEALDLRSNQCVSMSPRATATRRSRPRAACRRDLDRLRAGASRARTRARRGRTADGRIPRGRCRSAAVRRRQLRRRAVDLRRDVHAQSGAGRERADARLPPGGKIGMANWTPEGFIGRLFKIIGKYVPPAPGVKSPALWGSKAHLDEPVRRAGGVVAARAGTSSSATSRPRIGSRSSAPITARCSRRSRRSTQTRARRSRRISRAARRFNIAEDGTLVVPGEYLEVVVTKKGSSEPTPARKRSVASTGNRNGESESRTVRHWTVARPGSLPARPSPSCRSPTGRRCSRRCPEADRRRVRHRTRRTGRRRGFHASSVLPSAVSRPAGCPAGSASAASSSSAQR